MKFGIVVSNKVESEIKLGSEVNESKPNKMEL